MTVQQITQEHINELSSYIEKGDRGGFYWHLYQLTGVKQVLLQAAITTYNSIRCA